MQYGAIIERTRCISDKDTVVLCDDDSLETWTKNNSEQKYMSENSGKEVEVKWFGIHGGPDKLYPDKIFCGNFGN